VTIKVTGEQLLVEVREGITFSDSTREDEPIDYASPGFERITGYKLAEVVGRNCRFLQGPDTDRATVDEMRQAIATRSRCTVELINYRRDGTPFWNSVSLSPVFDADGKLWHYLGLQVDITERREHAQRERDFYDNVSHELKTPITALLGMIETLLRQPYIPPTEAQRMYGRLHHQALRLAHLVENVLSLAAVDPLHTQRAHAPLDLRDPLLSALEGALPAAESAGIRLEANLGDAPVTVRGEFGPLSTLAANLLDNAIKFSPAGSVVKLDLSVKGDDAVILVTDQGPGIHPDHCKHIFERFYRVEQTLGETSGAGLGLAIVKEAVESHKGSIALHSELGKGCAFEVRLPTA
jgi:two-component system, chemotaxis family, CheB/CheR fusion protein